MKKLGIRTAFTFDAHFKQAGFAIVPQVAFGTIFWNEEMSRVLGRYDGPSQRESFRSDPSWRSQLQNAGKG